MTKLSFTLSTALLLLIGPMAGAQERKSATAGLPAWVNDVGARIEPRRRRVCWVNSYGASADGTTNSTAGIQKAIDVCEQAGGGIVRFKPGAYVSGAIFLKRNIHLLLDQGVTLLGSQEDADYPSLWTRVAGIEMKWPAALINVNEQRNVKIPAVAQSTGVVRSGGTSTGRCAATITSHAGCAGQWTMTPNACV
ncbi:MAG TPA: glycosyl hydrolase family 28-related protein [Pyrinomonadaceae bacterium]|nr:glycosyl hydrolase family 28-related protein [Pyrinomonadaceae bacterium]